MTDPNQWLPATIPPPASPVQQPPMTPPPNVLLTIGDITVFPGVIVTPSGQLLLRGAIWTAVDNSHEQKRIPGWAIVLAILLFPITCGFSLLFLMATETNISGYVEVSVTNADRHHHVAIPSSGRSTFADVMSRVGYARSISW